jgi:hypothetical protein
VDKKVDDSPEHCLEVHYLNLISLLKKRTQTEFLYKTDYDDSMDVLSIELGSRYGCPPLQFREILENFIQNEYLCGIPGCRKFANISGYCCRNHFFKGDESGYLPSLSTGVELALVSQRENWSAHMLTSNHPSYFVIKEQFHASWLHRDGKPVIQRIYKLKVASNVFYRFKDKEHELGDSIVQFHGTHHSKECRFGIIPTGRPCADPSCSVCSICTTSFTTDKAETNAGRRMALRYGKGLYFSPVSSKSNDYTNRRKHHDGFYMRSIFLCKVVPGRKWVTEDGFMHEADCPPKG